MFSPLTNIQINSHYNFCKLNEQFDKQNNTKTLFGVTTLQELISTLKIHPSATPENITHQRIEFEIQRSFGRINSNVFNSNNYTDDLRPAFFFFNAMYCFANDFNNNNNIEDPITLTRLDNGITKWHPGQKRMHLYQVYYKPVYFMLTDYSDIKFDLDYDQTEQFDWSKGKYFLRTGNYEESMHIGHSNTNSLFKDIYGQVYGKLNKFDNFHTEKDNIFCLEEDVITVNNQKIAYKQDSIWKLIFNA